MGKYARENDFDSIVAEAGAAWSVDASLIKGIIGAESEFNPRAYRDEPRIRDGSYGLMQLLYSTARALGYSGATTGLYDPTTNIRLGTRYLADLIKTADRRGHGVDAAVSAYNAGFSTVRPGDGKRINDVNPDAPFINQSYVDKVLSLASYYRHGAQQLATVTVTARPRDHVSLSSLLFFGVPLLVLLIPRKRHR